MLSYLWGGSSKPKSITENEDPVLAMKEHIEAHGEFKHKMDGTLEFDDFLTLRSIIFRQTDRKFYPTKLALKVKQLEIFKRQD